MPLYPWDSDFNSILTEDCVTTLKSKLKTTGLHVNDMFYHNVNEPQLKYLASTLLSSAVEWDALNCVTYLRKKGADPCQKVDTWKEFTRSWEGFQELERDCRENEWDGTAQSEYDLAKEIWIRHASAKYHISEEVCRTLIDQADAQNWIKLQREHVQTVRSSVDFLRVCFTCEPCNSHDIRIRIWSRDDTRHTLSIFLNAQFNPIQIAILKYGRDSLIARVVRGELKAIREGYKEGFEAFCYYAEMKREKQNRHCSLLLAKRDSRLWYFLKGISKFGIPEELKEHIVGFAFFGNHPKDGKASVLP